MRRLLESKMEEVKGGWGEFCNDMVHILCCLPIYGE